MSERAQTEVGRLRGVLVKHARDAFRDQATIDREWEALGYLRRPDYRGAVTESDRLLELLEEEGTGPVLLPPNPGVGMDSLYPRDAAFVFGGGAILCRMGKAARASEPAALESCLEAAGLAVRGRIEGVGRLEGGDVAWLDDRTLAVGRGYRTNAEGIRQLRILLGDAIDELVEVPLPHWRGPGGVFHLMSMFSPLAPDLALVYSPLLPVPFRELLLGRGIELVEVPDEEFETMGCNALAVAPRRCVVLAGNPVTRARLEQAGVHVLEYEGREISSPGAGGPTCLTLPLRREAP